MPVGPTSIAAIFFDFDGVLVDSEPLHYRCWMEAVRSHGGYMDWPEYNQNLTGQTDRSAAETLLTPTGIDVTEQLIKTVSLAKRNAFQKALLSELSVAKEVSLWINNNIYNLYLGVVSSSCSSEVVPLLRKAKIHDRLDVLVFGDHVKQHKPNPEPYLTALARVNALASTPISASQCVVIEDSAPGIAAGEAAGMVTKAVRGPYEVVATLGMALSGARR
tara:strand:+ start:2416 stop:3072 length:657 start_codon:yes stop_codon:yes gene_type:complete